LATTLGETGGDTVTMTWLGETTPHPVPGGYLIGTAIFGLLLVGFVWAQIRASKFNPWLFWATIVASTTLGTTLADGRADHRPQARDRRLRRRLLPAFDARQARVP